MRAPIVHDPVSSQAFTQRESATQRDAALSLASEELSDQSLALAQPREQLPGAMTQFLHFLSRQYRILLALTLIGGVIGFGVLRWMTPMYTASAQIMVQRPGTAAQSVPLEDRLQSLRREQALVTSTPVLAAALTTPGVHELSMVRGRVDALRFFKRQIVVSRDHGDDLLDISVDCARPREGVALIAAVVDAYIRFRSGVHDESGNGPAGGSMTALTAERQQAAADLQTAQQNLQTCAAQGGLVAGDEQVNVADATVRALGERLAKAHVDTVTAQAAYDQTQQDLKNDPDMRDRLMHYADKDSSLADGDEQDLGRQICALQAQLASYGNRFRVNYGPTQMIRRKIEDLELERDAILQQRWQSAVRTESELSASFEQAKAGAIKSEAQRQAFEVQKSAVARARQKLDHIDGQLSELESSGKQIATVVSVIEPATASDQPTSPRAAVVLGTAAGAGLAVGIGVGLLRDRRRIAAVGPAAALGEGLPIVARLPAVSRRQLALSALRDRMLDSAAEFAVACRDVRAALERVHSFAGGRTIMLTSANPGEGKSTLASLLATTLAQEGRRVLLVDANLHAPRQEEIFDIDGEIGLGQILERGLDSQFLNHVHPGGDPCLDILLAGACDTPIESLLNSNNLTNLLASMATEYEYVLIDAPALSMGADARIIASSCDATVLLASESRLNRKVLASARRACQSVGGNVIGVVLNGGMSAVAAEPAPAAAVMQSEQPARPAPVQHVEVRPAPFVAEPAFQETAPEQNAERANHSVWRLVVLAAVLIAGWVVYSIVFDNPFGTASSGPSGLVPGGRGHRVAMSDLAACAQVVLLGGAMLLVYSIARRLVAPAPARINSGVSVGEAGLAIFVQCSVMVTALMLIGRWTADPYGLIACCGACAVASLIACALTPLRSLPILGIAPLLVALAGYGAAAIAVSLPHFEALALLGRPQPVAYALFGPLGALLGRSLLLLIERQSSGPMPLAA
jgi:capsular exopolysaccharide synthesis family protein